MYVFSAIIIIIFTRVRLKAAQLEHGELKDMAKAAKEQEEESKKESDAVKEETAEKKETEEQKGIKNITSVN